MVDLLLQAALLVEQLLHLRIVHRLGELHRDVVEVVQDLPQVRHAVLDVAADILRGVELRLLRQVADLGAGERACIAKEIGVDAGHDAQQRRLARAVRPDDANLGARIEGEMDALEDLAGGGHDLSEVAHREDVFAGHRAAKIGGRGTTPKGAPTGAPLRCVYCRATQLRCLLTSLVISNMLTWSFLKIALSAASALMLRRFFESCRPFRLMYAHSFFVTSVRGSGCSADDDGECRARLHGLHERRIRLARCLLLRGLLHGLALAADFFAPFFAAFFLAAIEILL